MGLTVRELLEIPDLRTWVVAGSGGLEREISWAHVSELADPTEWLGAGELLMTTGLGIPEAAEEQRAYVERLAAAGLSGLAIGHRMKAPELAGELSEAADRLSFPVLFTSYEVPFTAVARAVAEAGRSEERMRLVRTLRVYETVRLAAGSLAGSELVARLSEIVGCRLYVLDPDRGLPLLTHDAPAPPEVSRALVAARAERAEPLPASLRLAVEGREVLAMAVPASRPASMVVESLGDGRPDLPVLRHITAVAALELEREKAEHERKRRLGSEVLAGLLDTRISPESAARSLAEWGLEEEPRVLAVCGGDGGVGENTDLHLRLEDRRTPHLLLRRTPLLTALLPDTPEALAGFRKEIERRYQIGVSAPLGRLDRAPDARREAVWALESARASGEPLVRYGREAAPDPFLPRSLSEAERAVEEYLGRLIRYDEAHDTRLVASLQVFLEHNRSWGSAAGDLHVHKQTLIYRMRRVEELTGRSLSSTQDVAGLWLALRAGKAAGLIDPGR